MSLKSKLKLLGSIAANRKPRGLPWRDHIHLYAQSIRYQPLVFPDGTVIEKRSSDSVLDSREKLPLLQIPQNLKGKTFLDIGCAEGFFVIEAARRGAERAWGFDMTSSRIDIARMVAKTWDFADRLNFELCDLLNLPTDLEADVVICLAVCHHLHGGNHDTWAIISDPETHRVAFDNMMKAVAAVANHTRELAVIEYCFEYGANKPSGVDHQLLSKIWVERGIFKRVEYLGLAQNTSEKDRAIYHAFKQ